MNLSAATNDPQPTGCWRIGQLNLAQCFTGTINVITIQLNLVDKLGKLIQGEEGLYMRFLWIGKPDVQTNTMSPALFGRFDLKVLVIDRNLYIAIDLRSSDNSRPSCVTL